MWCDRIDSREEDARRPAWLGGEPEASDIQRPRYLGMLCERDQRRPALDRLRFRKPDGGSKMKSSPKQVSAVAVARALLRDFAVLSIPTVQAGKGKLSTRQSP